MQHLEGDYKKSKWLQNGEEKRKITQHNPTQHPGGVCD